MRRGSMTDVILVREQMEAALRDCYERAVARDDRFTSAEVEALAHSPHACQRRWWKNGFINDCGNHRAHDSWSWRYNSENYARRDAEKPRNGHSESCTNGPRPPKRNHMWQATWTQCGLTLDGTREIWRCSCSATELRPIGGVR